MYNLVNLFSCHSCFYNTMSSIDCTSSNQTYFSNNFNFFWRMNWWIFVGQLLKMSVWLSCFCVIWWFNVIRNLTFACKRIRKGTKWPCIVETLFYFFISFFMRHFMNTPDLFKTFLGTIITWFKLQFNACGTLKSGRLFAFWIFT